MDGNTETDLASDEKQNTDIDQPRQADQKSIRNDYDLPDYIPDVSSSSQRDYVENIEWENSSQKDFKRHRSEFIRQMTGSWSKRMISNSTPASFLSKN